MEDVCGVYHTWIIWDETIMIPWGRYCCTDRCFLDNLKVLNELSQHLFSYIARSCLIWFPIAFIFHEQFQVWSLYAPHCLFTAAFTVLLTAKHESVNPGFEICLKCVSMEESRKCKQICIVDNVVLILIREKTTWLIWNILTMLEKDAFWRIWITAKDFKLWWLTRCCWDWLGLLLQLNILVELIFFSEYQNQNLNF